MRPAESSHWSGQAASCLACGALVLAVQIRLAGRCRVLQWNPSLADLAELCGLLGDENRQRASWPLADFHSCEAYKA